MMLAITTSNLQLELLNPSEHSSSHRDRVSIVGRTNADSVMIRLNDRLIATMATQDSIFHAQVQLPYGFNTIGVRARRHGSEQIEQVLEILRGPKVKSQVEAIYPDYRFHGDTARDECLICHADDAQEFLVASDAKRCAVCHAEISARVRAHAPEDARSCTNCHVFDADLTLSPQRSYGEKNRCYGCHTDKIGEFAKEYVHGPVAGGACVICHDPHGSRFERNLRAPIGVLCLRCHTETAKESAAVHHPPFENGQCTSCHDPHSTNNRWVLVRSSHQLCLSCHGDENGKFLTHNHPFGVKPRGETHGLRLTEKGELECLSCHNPHATDSEHLLRTTASFTCAGCHPEQQ